MGENANADRWHTGPARETLGASFRLVCARDLYSENLSTVQSRLLVYEKRVTATHPRVEWSHASCPVASTYREVVGCVGGK